MQLTTKELLALAVPFAIAVSASYLFGYWGAFRINVLEFISLADIAKLALYPVLGIFIFFTGGFLFSELTTGSRLPVGGGAASPIGKFGAKYWRAIYGLLIMALVGTLVLMSEPYKWGLIIFLAIPFAIPMANHSLLIENMPNDKFRHMLCTAFVMLPLIAFGNGRMDAHLIKQGISRHVVDVSRSQLPLISDSEKPALYMGRLGETYVLFETKTNTIVFAKQKDDPPLFLLTK